MITWNTISRTSDDKITQAILLLETLSKDESIPIINFLRKKGGASFPELLQYLKINATELDQHLRQLTAVGAVIRKEKTTIAYYTINQGRLSTISKVAGRLNELRREGVSRKRSL